MNKKSLSILVPAIILMIIAVIIIDFTSGKPDRRGENPYEYNVDEYYAVDESLVHFKETKNIPIGKRIASTIDFYGGKIFIGGEGFLQTILPEGKQDLLIVLDGKPESLKVTKEHIFVAFNNSVAVLDHKGNTLKVWKIEGERTILTSIANKEDKLYVADAGNRRVLIYNIEGELLGQFEGKREGQGGHGFILPSANFDLVVNTYGELWVVNPGEHSIENYSDEGELRGYWTKSSMEIEGFTGCCNPAELAVMADGSFITSEKGMVRVKVYNQSGELKSVVAPPEKFIEEGHAPEPVADENGVIYILDFDKNTIRIFEPKNK